MNILATESYKWVFVGGKGGVGKTTTSCCLSIQLALRRPKVLIVSTDPAHNLSDAFCQKFGREPTLVNGFDNLFCMEIDANADVEKMKREMESQIDGGDAPDSSGGLGDLMATLTSSIPGIDEAMSFAELMKQVQTMDYDTIVFDTAPTGHTLRLLSFPTIMENALGKIMELKSKFGGMFGQMASMFGGADAGAGMEDMMLGKLEETREIINKVNTMFQDPSVTTFVCVCIPEFLSIYETERLVQELTKFGIDTHNIVINQVLFPEKDAEEMAEWYLTEKPKLSTECQDLVGKLLARKKMQDKYIGDCFELYGDLFNITLQPLLDYEVRGIDRLRQFSETLVNPVDTESDDA